MRINPKTVCAIALFLAAGAVRGDEFFVGRPNSGWWFKEIRCETPDTRPVWFGGTLRCENATRPVVSGMHGLARSSAP